MTEHHPWLHRYASFVAFCTFLLIIAGALVTGNDAGLSVPDWPTSFGTFRMPRMVGGVKFEHGHRMIAGTVGILTIILAIWIWRQDSRRWVRWVGFAAVMAVLAQAVLGGITVLFYLPVAISTAHATLAQIFFCLAASLAFFTGPDWHWDEAKLEDASTPSLQHLTKITTGVILVQLILGAVYRHSKEGIIAPHVVGACVVTLLVGWVVSTVLMRFAKQPGLLQARAAAGGIAGGATLSRHRFVLYEDGRAERSAAAAARGGYHHRARNRGRAAPGNEPVSHVPGAPISRDSEAGNEDGFRAASGDDVTRS